MNWLQDTRTSYDTVASNYAEFVRDSWAREPLIRGVLALFASVARDCGGPVVDVGCGPGLITAHLSDLGLPAIGIDLSPAMIGIARDAHPGVPFAVGSMTDLPLAECSAGALLAFFSVIHIPDDEVPGVLAQFHRVLRPGGVAMLGFHMGDRHTLKTEGYGGHPMRVHVHRRPMATMTAWLAAAGFVVEAETVLGPAGDPPAGIVVARRPS